MPIPSKPAIAVMARCPIKILRLLRRFILLGMAPLIVAASAFAGNALPPDLARAASEYDRAQVHGDRVALTRLLADDYVLINSRARVENKAQLIADYVAPDFRLNPFTVKHPVTKVWGNAAILSGVARLTGMSGGKPYDVTLHFADVWRRSQGRWQVVFTEVTAVPK